MLTYKSRYYISGSTDNVVAFSVALSQHLTLGPNQAVQYNEIITNFGNAYDSSHGHMITPIKGMYIIAVTCFNQAQDTDRLELVKNGNLVTSFYTQGNNRYGPMSQTVVVALEKGDVVWVRMFKEQAYSAHHLYGIPNHYYNTFSGILVFQL